MAISKNKKNLLILAAVVGGLLILGYLTNWFGFGGASSDSEAATQRVSNLRSQENMIIQKYTNDINRLGITNPSQARSRSGQLRMIADNINKSLKNIGSKSSASYGDPSVEKFSCGTPLGEVCTPVSLVFGFIRFCNCHPLATNN